MDMQAAIGDGRTLRRIIAMLVSLAVLAERAAVRTAPVRWLVLLILRRAETAAEAFVLEATGLPAFVETFAPAGNGPADALRLAARFHVMATALAALLPLVSRLERRIARRGIASGIAFVPAASVSGRLPGGWRPRTNDTS